MRPCPARSGLISGGGSGHEPLHGGFVGAGMLDAACAGAVFTSPVPDQMAAATKAVDGGAGVLHIVKNYTGDVLNFKLAAELAEDDGIEVQSVVLDDDVAVQDSLYTAGRRGTGATVLAEKIAGARAEAGGSLARRRRHLPQGQREGAVVRRRPHLVRHAAARARPIFDLGADEIEVGVGIHGEPGRRREKLQPAAALVEEMLDADPRRHAARRGSSGARVRERARRHAADRALPALQRGQQAALGRTGVTIARSLVGNYITSLEMAGASITLLMLDDELTGLWDAPVNTAALRWGS